MKSHNVSAGAVVTRLDSRILAVQRRDTGAWVTPGGIVESGEAITDATEREVFEETGVRVTIDGLSGIYQNLSTDVVTFVFRAGTAEQQTSSSNDGGHDEDETRRVRWLTLAEVDGLMTPPFVTRIHDALTRAQAPYIRTIHEPHLMRSKRSNERVL